MSASRTATLATIAADRPLAFGPAPLGRLIEAMTGFLRRRRAERELRPEPIAEVRLNDRMLRDIGLSRAEVEYIRGGGNPRDLPFLR